MTELHTFFMHCLKTLSQEFVSGLKSLQARFEKLENDWLRRDERWERELRLVEQRLRKLEAQEDPKKE